MRIQYLSDIHLEHLVDPNTVLEGLYKEATNFPDVLILAGDICDPIDNFDLYKIFSDHANVVLYVPGNHEYYGHSFEEVKKQFELLEARVPNFFVLDNKIVETHGKRFVGSTMWFDTDNYLVPLLKNYLNDYRQIKNFSEEIRQIEKDCTEFLYDSVEEGDFVITHHLPDFQSVSPFYTHEKTNCFYVKDMGSLIRDRKPAYWFHGHTHDSVDYQFQDTRVLANPLDYPRFWGDQVAKKFQTSFKA